MEPLWRQPRVKERALWWRGRRGWGCRQERPGQQGPGQQGPGQQGPHQQRLANTMPGPHANTMPGPHANTMPGLPHANTSMPAGTASAPPLRNSKRAAPVTWHPTPTMTWQTMVEPTRVRTCLVNDVDAEAARCHTEAVVVTAMESARRGLGERMGGGGSPRARHMDRHADGAWSTSTGSSIAGIPTSVPRLPPVNDDQ